MKVSNTHRHRLAAGLLPAFLAIAVTLSAVVALEASHVWTEQAKVTADDGAASDFFGYSVAVDGNTDVVGAPADDIGGNADQGSAYVFTCSGTVWSKQAKLTASDGAASDFFGSDVALDGNTPVAGAEGVDIGATDAQGSVYVFTRSGTTWTQQARLIAFDGATGDNFGVSVALSGNTVVAGAAYDQTGGNLFQGSAYVFTRSGTTWSQQAKLTADDGGANAYQGSAYVFTRAGSVWTQQAKPTAADGAASDQFGYSVALSGDTAVVGACVDNIGGNGDQGSAYVFTRSGSIWSQQAHLAASDGAANDFFGRDVALDGNTGVIGAEGDDVGGNANQGSAYVFTTTADPTPVPGASAWGLAALAGALTIIATWTALHRSRRRPES